MEEEPELKKEPSNAIELKKEPSSLVVELSEIVLPFAISLIKITKARVKETEEF